MQENRRARPSPAFGVSVADLGRFRSHDIEYFSERTMDLLDEANEALDVGEFDVGNAAMADALHLGLCAHDRRGYATEGHEDDTMPYHIRFAFDNYHVTRTMAQRKFRICYDWDSLMGRAYGIPLRLDIEVFTVFQFARSLTKTVHLRHPVPVADRPGQVRRR